MVQATTRHIPINQRTMIIRSIVPGIWLVSNIAGCAGLSSLNPVTPPSPSTVAASSASTSSSSRVAFPGLQASQFRHGLDRDITSFLQTSLPGSRFVEEALRRSFPIVEQGVRLDLLSNAVKVSSKQLPELHNVMVEACQILDMHNNHQSNSDSVIPMMPELYLQSSSQANAYTLAFRGKDTQPIVVITSALVDQCTLPEIQAVLGHELGHLKCEHSLWLTLGGLTSIPFRSVAFPPLGGNIIDSILQRWKLAAEYTCDRSAMLVAQDVHVVVSALLKLVAGTSRYGISTDAFVEQCTEYNRLLDSANPLVRAYMNRQLQDRTHPLPVRRVVALQEWSMSDEYLNLLKSGKELP